MLNKSIVAGRIVRDPDLRSTQSGVPIASFTVACDRDVARDSDGERQADFIDIVAWRSKAEFVSKHFHKGDLIMVAGRLQFREWVDKDGNKRRSAEINAENIYFGVDRKSRRNDSPETDAFDADDSELPF